MVCAPCFFIHCHCFETEISRKLGFTPLEEVYFYLPILHFFKYMLIVQEVFALLFHTCIYHTLIILTVSIAYGFSTACFLIIQQLTVHFIIISLYTDSLCFSIVQSLSLSFPLLPPHSKEVRLNWVNCYGRIFAS
jgi:hypothetical protein